MQQRPSVSVLILSIILVATALLGCAEQQKPIQAAVMPAEMTAGKTEGYLSPEALPNSVALLPSPPAENSNAFALDVAMNKQSFTLRGSPAWDLAVLDANLKFPEAAGAYSCAVNAPLTADETPHLLTLLNRALRDAGASTGEAKQKYMRPRPFMVNKQPLCQPVDGGSYPSGHNAAGMAWGLILAEIAPAQANAIFARAQAFGLSRVVCNAHWYSDTLQGRYLGAYTVARLHADPAFLADLQAAKAELQAAHAKGLKPNRDCEAEKKGMELQKELFKDPANIPGY